MSCARVGLPELPEEVWLHILGQVTDGRAASYPCQSTCTAWHGRCLQTFRRLSAKLGTLQSQKHLAAWLRCSAGQLTHLQLSRDSIYEAEGLAVLDAILAHGISLRLQHLSIHLLIHFEIHQKSVNEKVLKVCRLAPDLRWLSLANFKGCCRGLTAVTQLQALELSGGTLSHEDLQLLSSSLTGLTALTLSSLVVRRSPTGFELDLPSNLQQLVLSQVDYDGSFAGPDPTWQQAVTSCLSKLTCLTTLAVTGFSRVSSAAAALESLKALCSLSCLKIQASVSTIVPLSKLSSLSSVTRLVLRNLLAPQDAAVVFSRPELAAVLQHLEVDSCGLVDPLALSPLTSLTYLSAQLNSFTGSFAPLSSLQQLRHLSLQHSWMLLPRWAACIEAWDTFAQLACLTHLEFSQPSAVTPGAAGLRYGSRHDVAVYAFTVAEENPSRVVASCGPSTTQDQVPHRPVTLAAAASTAAAAAASWSKLGCLKTLDLNLEALLTPRLAVAFRRGLQASGMRPTTVRLVGRGYKQGMGMLGVSAFAGVQELDFSACDLLSSGSFRQLSELQGLTYLDISNTERCSWDQTRLSCLADWPVSVWEDENIREAREAEAAVKATAEAKAAAEAEAAAEATPTAAAEAPFARQSSSEWSLPPYDDDYSKYDEANGRGYGQHDSAIRGHGRQWAEGRQDPEINCDSDDPDRHLYYTYRHEIAYVNHLQWEEAPSWDGGFEGYSGSDGGMSEGEGGVWMAGIDGTEEFVPMEYLIEAELRAKQEQHGGDGAWVVGVDGTEEYVPLRYVVDAEVRARIGEDGRYKGKEEGGSSSHSSGSDTSSSSGSQSGSSESSMTSSGSSTSISGDDSGSSSSSSGGCRRRKRKQRPDWRNMVLEADSRKKPLASPRAAIKEKQLWDLSCLPQLRHLNMSNCRVTSASCLSALTSLTRLAAAGNAFDCRTVAVVGYHLLKLQHLVLEYGSDASSFAATQMSFGGLSRLTQLTHLQLMSNRCTNTFNYRYSITPAATTKSSSSNSCRSNSFKLFTNFSELQATPCCAWHDSQPCPCHLNGPTAADPSGIRFLCFLQPLKQLHHVALPLTAAPLPGHCQSLASVLFQALSSAQHLTHLELRSCRFLDGASLAGVAAFAGKTQQLDLSHVPQMVSPSSLMQLAKSLNRCSSRTSGSRGKRGMGSALTSLVLSHNRLSRNSHSRAGKLYCFDSCSTRSLPLAALVYLPALQHLEIDDCGITNITAMSALQQLTFLSAAGNSFGKEALGVISQIQLLQYLDLQYSLAAGVSTPDACMAAGQLTGLLFLRFSSHASRGWSSLFSSTKQVKLPAGCGSTAAGLAPAPEDPNFVWHFQRDSSSLCGGDGSSNSCGSSGSGLHVCVQAPVTAAAALRMEEAEKKQVKWREKEARRNRRQAREAEELYAKVLGKRERREQRRKRMEGALQAPAVGEEVGVGMELEEGEWAADKEGGVQETEVEGGVGGGNEDQQQQQQGNAEQQQEGKEQEQRQEQPEGQQQSEQQGEENEQLQELDVQAQQLMVGAVAHGPAAAAAAVSDAAAAAASGADAMTETGQPLQKEQLPDEPACRAAAAATTADLSATAAAGAAGSLNEAAAGTAALSSCIALRELHIGVDGLCSEEIRELTTTLAGLSQLQSLRLQSAKYQKDMALLGVEAFPGVQGLDISCCKGMVTAGSFYNTTPEALKQVTRLVLSDGAWFGRSSMDGSSSRRRRERGRQGREPGLEEEGMQAAPAAAGGPGEVYGEGSDATSEADVGRTYEDSDGWASEQEEVTAFTVKLCSSHDHPCAAAATNPTQHQPKGFAAAVSLDSYCRCQQGSSSFRSSSFASCGLYFLACAPPVPLTHLEIDRCHVHYIADLGQLHGLTYLSAAGNMFSDKQALCVVQQLPGLKHLNLGYSLVVEDADDGGGELLGTVLQLPGLTYLNLSHYDDLEDQLGRAQGLLQLLAGIEDGSGGGDQGRHQQQQEQQRQKVWAAGAHQPGIRAAAGGRTLVLPLKELHVDNCNLSDAAVGQLAACFQQLEVLSLGWSDASAAGLAALAPLGGTLTQLCVKHTYHRLDCGAAAMIAVTLPRLQGLDLSGNKVGVAGVAALQHLKGLKWLGLGGNGIEGTAKKEVVKEWARLGCKVEWEFGGTRARNSALETEEQGQQEEARIPCGDDALGGQHMGPKSRRYGDWVVFPNGG